MVKAFIYLFHLLTVFILPVDQVLIIYFTSKAFFHLLKLGQGGNHA